jgi:dihydroxyacetone kinase-like protein
MGTTGADIRSFIEQFAATVSDNKDYLTKLDSAIGDADHGINMDRGMKAAMEKVSAVESNSDAGNLLKTVGMALVSKVGGAGGPLYGTLFLQLGTKLTGKSEISLEEWAGAVDAAVTGVQARGKAQLGDKTMIDALAPARDALNKAAANGDGLVDGLKTATAAAEEGMRATIPLVARKGRASYLGERSAGHQDPGATSSFLLMQCAEETLGGN